MSATIGTRQRRSAPWGAPDLLVAYLMTVVGFGLVLLAYWAASGAAAVREQIPWVNVGVVGLLVIGTSNCFWLLNGRRSLGERREVLLGGIDAAMSLGGRHCNEMAAPSVELVVAPGMTHFHRPECQLAMGKRLSPATLRAHQRAGRSPCGVCRP